MKNAINDVVEQGLSDELICSKGEKPTSNYFFKKGLLKIENLLYQTWAKWKLNRENAKELHEHFRNQL